jgi:outer membrane protein OmpA-like peptidoglycan-associated protein
MTFSRLLATRVLALAAALLLAGCAAQRSPSVNSVAPPQSRLDGLHDQLRSDLVGTPVAVDRVAGGQVLRIGVPRSDSFEAGRSAVKPALGAVLARVAPSLKANARWAVRVAGPTDGSGKNVALAVDRAAAARDYLVGRGASPLQFLPPLRNAESDALELRIAASAEALSTPPAK